MACVMLLRFSFLWTVETNNRRYPLLNLILPASHTCLTAGAVQYELEYCASSSGVQRYHHYDWQSFPSRPVPALI